MGGVKIVDEKAIAASLGQLVAGQEHQNREIGRFRQDVNTQNDKADESRRRLYQSLNELKDRFSAEVTEIKVSQKMLEMRVEAQTNQVTMMSPNVLDIPQLKAAVAALDSGHQKLKTTVDTLERAKSALEGAAKGAVNASKVWWLMIVTMCSVISAIITGVWHWISTSGSTPGR